MIVILVVVVVLVVLADIQEFRRYESPALVAGLFVVRLKNVIKLS